MKRKPTRSSGRQVAFRLEQVPAKVRLAALPSIRDRGGEELYAAMFPSDRVYLISVEAWESVMGTCSPQTAETSCARAVSNGAQAG